MYGTSDELSQMIPPQHFFTIQYKVDFTKVNSKILTIVFHVTAE